MKVEQPGCINEGTSRGSDGATNEIVDLREEFAVDLREEFAAVDTRSRATIVIIHARRDVETISTHRTRTSHNSCVIVLQVSGFSGPRSARSLSQGILEPYSAAHNLKKVACYCQVGKSGRSRLLYRSAYRICGCGPSKLIKHFLGPRVRVHETIKILK